MKTIHGRNPQNCALLVILLLFPVALFCQQKITIKDKDGMAMGHFVVETFYLSDGNEIALNGNIPTAESKLGENQFKLKIGNLVWFDPSINDILSINSKNINVNNVDDVRIDLSKGLLKLNPGDNKPLVLNVTTQDFGDFKLDVPFETTSFKGRFLQPLSVYNSSTIKSKDVRLIWKSVDDTNAEEIKSFIDEYEKLPVAKKYINSARRKLKKILVEEKEAKLKEEARTEVLGEQEEELRHLENLETDVKNVAKGQLKMKK